MRAKLLIFGLLMLTAVSVLTASDNKGSDDIFPGHDKKNEELIKTVTNIVVAKFTSLGNLNLDAPGEVLYVHAKIEIASCLKGSLSGTLQARYNVQDFSEGPTETLPVVGTQYIMFIRDYHLPDYRIEKILPATDTNLASIKALIDVRLK
jgi:hypothetical protein